MLPTPISDTALAAAYADFGRRYPTFDTTLALDDLRAAEYRRLDDQGQVYLDYTGGGLYAESQVRQHMDLLTRHVFGNPHSSNPTSLASTRLDEQARRYVLEYFNASPDEYVAIFTMNASGALKLVGEAYPFAPGSRYALTFDNQRRPRVCPRARRDRNLYPRHAARPAHRRGAAVRGVGARRPERQ